ncbi:ScbR family autoregulator-binding transcription factor [Conyzicola sp.]|uniref:ScbR family autoregulator-binding transcription factor n=1 Tax=Conyzicola sp. TaxID=1969404 RepID=UPI0039897F81
MARQERAQITRDRLIDGAASTFCRLGYVATTTADIALEAGTTRGALYFHFSTKEEIARAVIDKEQLLAIESGTRIMQLNRSALETMLMLCVDLAQRLRVDPIVQAGIRLTTENANLEPPLRAPYEQWLTTFSTIAERAVQEGDFRADVDPNVFARFLIPAYTGVQLVSDTFTGREDLMPRIREMWMFLFAAVVAEGRAPGAQALLDGLIPAE